MIVLNSAASIRLVTTSANAVDVVTAFADNTSSSFSPAPQATTIAAAATTTIIAAPAASTTRNISAISVRARGGANTVTVQYFDGAAFELIQVALAAGDRVEYENGSGFRIINAAGEFKQVAGGGGGGASSINVSAGTTSQNLSAVVFSNSNGVSFGLNGSTITGSVATSLTNIRVSAGTTSNLLSALTFANANGVSFGLNASTITGSIASSLTAINVSAGTTSNNLSALVFSNSNGVTFGLNGSTITASAAGGGGGGIAASASIFGGSVGTGTLVFNNATAYSNFTSGVGVPNVLFSINGQTMLASAFAAFGDTAGEFLGTRLDLLNSNGVTFGMTTSAGGVGRIINATASFEPRLGLVSHVGGNSVSNVTRLAFSNASNVTWSLSTAAGAATVLASVAAGGGGLTNINVSAGTTSQNLSALVFSNSNGVSFGLNGSTVTASAAGGGGGGITLSGWRPYGHFVQGTQSAPLSNTMQAWVDPVGVPSAFQFDRLEFPMQFSLTTNTHSGTYRMLFGIYTRNASTLSLLHSTTFSTAVTVSTGNTSLFQGPGFFTVPWTSTVSAGNYWFYAAWGSTTAGANASITMYHVTNNGSSVSRLFGQASNATRQLPLGMGRHTASASIAPASLAFSHIAGVNGADRRPMFFQFGSGTA